MDQPNPNTPSPHDPNDLSFNVMPQSGGKNFSSPSAPSFKAPSAPPSPSMTPPPSSHSSKWAYYVIGLVVLLALGGVAYYMLGTKKTDETPQAVTKLPKQWLSQYFNAEVCEDQATCGDDADPETDGLKNYDEFKAGTNPL